MPNGRNAWTLTFGWSADDPNHGFVYLTEGQSAVLTAAAFAELDRGAAGEVAA